MLAWPGGGSTQDAGAQDFEGPPPPPVPLEVIFSMEQEITDPGPTGNLILDLMERTPLI